MRLEAITPAWINHMLAGFGRHSVAPCADASTPPVEVAPVRNSVGATSWRVNDIGPGP